MDKEFILQCEKAVEIQGRVFKKGDIYCDTNGNVGVFFTYSESHPFIWLPTQEQLQRMIDDFDTVVFDFPSWVWNQKGFETAWKTGHKPSKLFTSMNQLWLAFVMRELYNKNWNGKDWVL